MTVKRDWWAVLVAARKVVEPDGVYGVVEITRITGCARHMLHNHLASGSLRGVKRLPAGRPKGGGYKWQVTGSDLLAWLKRRADGQGSRVPSVWPAAGAA